MISKERYNRFVAAAENENKIGGNHHRAQVWAALALAEATALNEPEQRLEIIGTLTVDT